MKRLLTMIMVLVLSLAACGGADEAEEGLDQATDSPSPAGEIAQATVCDLGAELAEMAREVQQESPETRTQAADQLAALESQLVDLSVQVEGEFRVQVENLASAVGELEAAVRTSDTGQIQTAAQQVEDTVRELPICE